MISQDDRRDYGLHPTILDGSGLSRNDRTVAAEVVDLLREIWRHPDRRVLSASLPIVGVDGHRAGRSALKTAAQGRCIAKTGTLNYVTNLAGYCHSRSGHTLAFALFDRRAGQLDGDRAIRARWSRRSRSY